MAKPERRIMRRFSINEISAVHNPAQKGARMLIMKRDDGGPDILDDIQKGCSMLLTTDVAGHAHLIDLGEFERFKGGGHTGPGYVLAEDGTQGQCHAHPFVIDDDGNVTIGAAAGHSHDLAASRQTVEELGVEVAKMSEGDLRKLARRGLALPDGSLPIRNHEELDDVIKAFDEVQKSQRLTAALHIRARAGALGAMDALPSDGALAEILGSAKKSETANQEHKDMANAELEKKLADMTAIAGMNDAEKAHLAKLSDEPREAFLKADSAGRSAIIEKSRGDDPVVYTTGDGIELRKSDGAAAIALAKSLDEMRKENAALKTVLETTKATSDAEEVERVVAKLEHIGKPIEEKRTMVAAIMKLDGEAKKTALDALMAGAAQFATVQKYAGVPAVGSTQGTALQELDKLVGSRLEKAEAGVTYEKAMADILMTPRGAQLYEQAYPQQHGTH